MLSRELIASLEYTYHLATGNEISILPDIKLAYPPNNFVVGEDSYALESINVDDVYGNEIEIAIKSLHSLTTKDVELIKSFFKLASIQSGKSLVKNENDNYLDAIEVSNSFFVALNKSGSIMRLGKSWQKYQPHQEMGYSFTDNFIAENASKSLTEQLEEAKIKQKIFFFSNKSINGKFKSTVIEHNHIYILLVQPVINATYSLKIYDLTINDFMPHDYIAEYVFLQSTSQKSLDELRQLVKKIKVRNKEIESISRFPSENPNPILRLTKEGEFLYINDAARMNFDREQFVEQVNLRELISSTMLAKNLNLDGECVLNGHTYLYRSIYFENEQYLNIYLFDITKYLKQINNLNKHLIHQRDFYENILDSLPTEIFVLNNQKDIVYSNQSALPNSEHRKQIVGKKLDTTLANIDVKINQVLKHTALIGSTFIDKKEISWEEELSLKSSSVKYSFRKLIPFSNNLEDFVILSSNDITDLVLAKKEIDRINEGLELKIKQRTYQLENAVKELDSFSYSVSHDLRSPLRAVNGWSFALMEDYGDKLDEIAIGYLNRMRSESIRMGNLIDDLLSLSKIGQRQIIRKQINFNDFCLQILKRIIEVEKYAYPEVIIHDNDPIYADENLLDILINNLLSNALKFSSKKENPKIEIGVELMENIPFYYIKDNGAGFEMNNASKLFGAFQRMHRQSDFSGTGIGLATAKRIVNLHEGIIFAESKINEGATFYFNLSYKI